MRRTGGSYSVYLYRYWCCSGDGAGIYQLAADGDSFDRIGVAGAGLTAIDLPDQAMNITGNITGNLSGSVGSVTGNVGGNVTGSVGSVTGNVGGNVAGSVASVTAAVTLPTIPTNWITAAGINSAATLQTSIRK